MLIAALDVLSLSWRSPFDEGAFDCAIPPATTPPAKARNWLIYGNGYGITAPADAPTAFGSNDRARNWREAAQPAPCHDVEAISGANVRSRTAHEPTPFLACVRLSSSIAFSDPFKEEPLRAGDDEISHDSFDLSRSPPCSPG